jgi:hypothetical protein
MLRHERSNGMTRGHVLATEDEKMRNERDTYIPGYAMKMQLHKHGRLFLGDVIFTSRTAIGHPKSTLETMTKTIHG